MFFLKYEKIYNKNHYRRVIYSFEYNNISISSFKNKNILRLITNTNNSDSK